ncbi:IucA/IucC family protein [Microbulbifer mangrovi]|uniref:IucA/IucC family protein n=1 Tax=Microbulbifer mangrovi TaxID=927787 RepID=UPI0009905621|nr:IucA/IucC family protein [Microbulbifer mangrovi]
MSEASEGYITHRIINACIREKVGEIAQATVTRGCPPAAVRAKYVLHSEYWLTFSTGKATVYLPVQQCDFMQSWRTNGDQWLLHSKGDWLQQRGYRQWLSLLASAQDEESRALFSAYCKESDTAVRHRDLCLEAYQDQRAALSLPLFARPHWWQRLLCSEQMASYLDHPYYPTARAKHGLDDEDLRRYAPEFMRKFSLHWLAVEKSRLTLTAPLPEVWPSFSEVGLPEDFSHSHYLMPVHPLTWVHLELPADGVIRAPKAAREVLPTLSVRTVLFVDQPELHIKLPLSMSTLGAKNIRSIKPSTLYDGHIFSHLLTEIERRDQALRGDYLHCDEKSGGHYGESRELGFILRRYPAEQLQDSTLVPVAALASPLPDGRLYLEHLVDQFYEGDLYAWLDAYISLMLKVHLRLWLVYGIALEANQQNAVLNFCQNKPLRLVMKDNDSARILPSRCISAIPELRSDIENLRDARIRVDEELPLAQMFCTITLQLNIAAIIEAISERELAPRQALYKKLQKRLRAELDTLQCNGVDTDFAIQFLLEQENLPIKYLLSAGSLLSKSRSGAADINKHYGLSAPNFLRYTNAH